jgi:hypothetical protein
MKDAKGNDIIIGQSVVVEGKRGTIQTIRNDGHLTRVAISDGRIIFAVSREINPYREGHHTKCIWGDCQGGCWDIFYE